MKINRHNYEEFLLDFIEGNLSANEAEAVQSFLDKNPDIKAEIEDLLNFKLSDDDTKFENKSLLKKDSSVDIEGISKFERLSVAFLENDINDEEHLLLSKMLENSETKQQEHQIIQKTKLSIDAGIVFPNKSKLKRIKLVNTRRIAYFAGSIAASVALMISFFLINSNDKIGEGLALNYADFEFPTMRQNNTTKYSTNDEQFVINKTIIESTKVDTLDNIRTRLAVNSIESKQTLFIENTSEENFISTETLIAISTASAMQNKNQTEIEVEDYVNNTLQELGIEKQNKEKQILVKAGKSVAQFFTKLFNKNIQIKKIGVEDGRKLYAVRAGSLEFYTNVKDRKSKNKKPPVAN